MTAEKKELPTGPVLRRPAAMAFTGFGPTQFDELIATGKFPAPIPIGKRTVVWDREEVLAWYEERKKKRAEEMAARKAGRAAKPVQKPPKKKVGAR